MADDKDLVREIQQGSRGAMESFIRKHYRLVYAYIYRRVGDRHVAYDLTQDVFLSVVRSIHRYRQSGDCRAWLLTIATNRCRDYFKGSRRVEWMGEEAIDTMVPAGVDNVAYLFERNEQRAHVKRALAELPDYQREALVLRFYHDLKISDIASITGTNESTVKSRLRQGIARLKKRFGEEGKSETEG